MVADKARHFLAGASVSLAVAGALPPEWGLDVRLSLSLGTALALGGGKELVDAAGLGTPEWADALWTLAGGVLGTLVAWVALGVGAAG